MQPTFTKNAQNQEFWTKVCSIRQFISFILHMDPAERRPHGETCLVVHFCQIKAHIALYRVAREAENVSNLLFLKVGSAC